MSIIIAAALAAAAFAGGAVNAVAGGGSLISFPALLAAGVPPLTANMTNTVAMVFQGVGSVSASRPELRGQGRTIVVVSHALGSVRSMCDHAAWLDHGQLRSTGTASQVIDDYLETVHTDRVDEPAGVGTRWGSGEGRIERIEVLDADGTPTSKVHTGDRVTFRFHYATHEPIPTPVFGLGIHTVDGVHVTGPNTREAGVEVDRIDGSGIVDLVVERLLLLPGTYDISAALTDHAALHQYDYRHRAHRFDVGPGTPHETYGGVMSLDGRWHLQ